MKRNPSKNGCVEQSVAYLTHELEVSGLIPSPATFVSLSADSRRALFLLIQEGQSSITGEVCAQSTG